MSTPQHSPQQCVRCGAALSDAAVCSQCVQAISADLAAIVALAPELQVTLTRQDAISDDRPSEYRPQLGLRLAAADLDPRGRPWSGTLRPTRLPYAPAAAELAQATTNTLSTWCRLLAEELHPDDATGTDLPEPSVDAMAHYLRARAGWWRRQPWSAQLGDELRTLARALERAVDRRAPQSYAGPCNAPLHASDAAPGASGTFPCPAHLYAEAGADYVTCPACGARHDVHTRRAELLRVAEDRLAHAELVAGALSGLGVAVSVDQVNGWARRGRLVMHGRDRLGRKLYRVGDALAVATELMRAQHTRRSGRTKAPRVAT